MTFAESIALNKARGEAHAGAQSRRRRVDRGRVRKPGDYAQALINELQANGVRPKDAYPQSFNVNDVLY